MEEDVEGRLVPGVHGEVSGGEVGRREGVPRSAGLEEGLDGAGVAVLGGVHERSEAVAVEARSVGAGVDQRLYLLGVAVPRRRAQLLELAHAHGLWCARCFCLRFTE